MDYRKHLTQDILPFWLDNAIDEEFGGIFTRLDKTGKLYGIRQKKYGRKSYECEKANKFIFCCNRSLLLDCMRSSPEHGGTNSDANTSSCSKR